MMIYAGIGSRKTPESYCLIMTVFAYTVDGILRSGGADGADKAFETGASEKEIYLPQKGFNGNTSALVVTEFDNFDEIFEIAKCIHSKWDACTDFAKLLHSRNVCQVLGKDLEKPSDVIICWTKDGANNRDVMPSMSTGGTGTAIKLAERFDIPVLNIQNDSDFKTMLGLVDYGQFMYNLGQLASVYSDVIISEVIDIFHRINS